MVTFTVQAESPNTEVDIRVDAIAAYLVIIFISCNFTQNPAQNHMDCGFRPTS
jgi:hypothetical protein